MTPMRDACSRAYDVLAGVRVDSAFGLSRAFFLMDGILAFNNEANESGHIFLFRTQSETPLRTVRRACGFREASISPDEAFAAGVCVTISQAELSFKPSGIKFWLHYRLYG
jgi:hypothetical protein